MNVGQKLDFGEKSRQKNKKILKRNMLITTAFLAASMFFQEIFTAIFTAGLSLGQFFLLIFFTLAEGSFLAVIISLISNMKVRNWVIGILTGVNSVIFSAQIVYYKVFSQYFAWETVSMAGNLFKSFLKETFAAIGASLIKLIIIFVPFILFMVFRKRFGAYKNCKGYIRMRWIFAFIVSALLCLIFTMLPKTARETYFEGEVNHTSQLFGIMTSTRRGIEQLIFGNSEYHGSASETEGSITMPHKRTETESGTESAETSGEPGSSSAEQPPVPKVYGDNVLDIDFDALIEKNKKNSDIVSLLKYFQSRTPTKQNKYTGYFEGKNLIFITLESFCTEFVSEELTPILYNMLNSGFVFTNYYNSLWGGSTSTGEYVNLTGMFYNSANAMRTVGDISVPFSLGNQLMKKGYNTFAFHPNDYTYYNRAVAYPSLGYEYYYGRGGTTILDKVTRKVTVLDTGIEEFVDRDGNGWTMKAKGTKPQWPESDHEMAKLTVDKFIDKQPFHVYYMSISGHCNYNWAGNDMCSKHRTEVQNLGYKTEGAQAYVAGELEVELMLKELVDALDATGILDNTVFVMTADHYPYELGKSDDDESLAELYGLDKNNIRTNFDLYRNGLIIWCSSMKEKIVVDKTCSALDILPTVSNLFGLEYDSRLLAGVDLLSDADPIVIINTLQKLNGSFIDWCWITDYGYKKGAFVANEDYEWTSASKSAYSKEITSRVSSMKNYFFKVLSTDFYSYLDLK